MKYGVEPLLTIQSAANSLQTSDQTSDGEKFHVLIYTTDPFQLSTLEPRYERQETAAALKGIHLSEQNRLADTDLWSTCESNSHFLQ
jgi:hypothetical protein